MARHRSLEVGLFFVLSLIEISVSQDTPYHEYRVVYLDDGQSDIIQDRGYMSQDHDPQYMESLSYGRGWQDHSYTQERFERRRRSLRMKPQSTQIQRNIWRLPTRFLNGTDLNRRRVLKKEGYIYSGLDSLASVKDNVNNPKSNDIYLPRKHHIKINDSKSQDNHLRHNKSMDPAFKRQDPTNVKPYIPPPRRTVDTHEHTATGGTIKIPGWKRQLPFDTVETGAKANRLPFDKLHLSGPKQELSKTKHAQSKKYERNDISIDKNVAGANDQVGAWDARKHNLRKKRSKKSVEEFAKRGRMFGGMHDREYDRGPDIYRSRDRYDSPPRKSYDEPPPRRVYDPPEYRDHNSFMRKPEQIPYEPDPEPPYIRDRYDRGPKRYFSDSVVEKRYSRRDPDDSYDYPSPPVRYSEPPREGPYRYHKEHVELPYEREVYGRRRDPDDYNRPLSKDTRYIEKDPPGPFPTFPPATRHRGRPREKHDLLDERPLFHGSGLGDFDYFDRDRFDKGRSPLHRAPAYKDDDHGPIGRYTKGYMDRTPPRISHRLHETHKNFRPKSFRGSGHEDYDDNSRTRILSRLYDRDGRHEYSQPDIPSRHDIDYVLHRRRPYRPEFGDNHERSRYDGPAPRYRVEDDVQDFRRRHGRMRGYAREAEVNGTSVKPTAASDVTPDVDFAVNIWKSDDEHDQDKIPLDLDDYGAALGLLKEALMTLTEEELLANQGPLQNNNLDKSTVYDSSDVYPDDISERSDGTFSLSTTPSSPLPRARHVPMEQMSLMPTERTLSEPSAEIKPKRIFSAPRTFDVSKGYCGFEKQLKGFCNKRLATLYGHPVKDCFIQCDANGNTFMRMCPDGLEWKGTQDAADYNMCG